MRRDAFLAAYKIRTGHEGEGFGKLSAYRWLSSGLGTRGCDVADENKIETNADGFEDDVLARSRNAACPCRGRTGAVQSRYRDGLCQVQRAMLWERYPGNGSRYQRVASFLLLGGDVKVLGFIVQ